MSDSNGGMTIRQFLDKHPVEAKAKRVELNGGGHVYFRRPSFAEVRALGIAQDRGTPAEAARAELDHLARIWCVDEQGTPAMASTLDVHELAKRDVDAVADLMAAAARAWSDDVEAEAKN